MKTLKQFSLDPILIMVIFSLIPKNKQNSDVESGEMDKTPSTNQDIIAIIVTNGNWKISCYWKSEHNEMINFNGFNFSFGANDILTATDGINSYEGTWSLLEVNENPKSISNLKFNITFGNTIYFVPIVDGWETIEKNSNYFEISEYSKKNGVTDFLTFSKN